MKTNKVTVYIFEGFIYFSWLCERCEHILFSGPMYLQSASFRVVLTFASHESKCLNAVIVCAGIKIHSLHYVCKSISNTFSNQTACSRCFKCLGNSVKFIECHWFSRYAKVNIHFELSLKCISQNASILKYNRFFIRSHLIANNFPSIPFRIKFHLIRVPSHDSSAYHITTIRAF